MASPIEAASSGWVETVGRPLDRPAAPLTHPAIVEKSPGHLSQPSATRARYAAVAAAAKRLLADASTTLARIELCALCAHMSIRLGRAAPCQLALTGRPSGRPFLVLCVLLLYGRTARLGRMAASVRPL